MPEYISSGNSTTDINIESVGIQYNNQNISVTFFANNSQLIKTYRYKIDRGLVNFVPWTNSASYLINATGLAYGGKYTITAQSYIGTNASGEYGNEIQYTFNMPLPSKAASIIETVTAIQPGNYTGTTSNISNQTGNPSNFAQSGYTVPADYLQVSKSLFKLSQPTQSKYKYTVAYKSFSQLKTTESYYSFGTNLFFDATVDKPIQSGGFAFFVSNDGMDGYVLKIETTASSAAADSQKEFQIYRLKGGKLTVLEDSQKGTSKTLKAIYGGQSYKIDIKVARDSNKVIITAYVNGFKITATDSEVSKLISPTQNVAMICNLGTIYFDYVYGMTIDEDSYGKDYFYNVYEGKYPQNIISFLYGEKVSNNDPAVSITNKGFIEEFGAVARELRVVKTKYESRPAFPLYASTGINSFAKIIGQRLTSSGAEIYVLNNSGTYIPLDDSGFYSFFIVGKYISQSGVLEYIDSSASDYTSKEPVIFQSTWIQKNSDVVSLANWIKNIWSKKQMIINMSVFGNPMLSVGDVIKIDYPYHGLTTSQKFLITNVNQSYNSGLETSITCRSL